MAHEFRIESLNDIDLLRQCLEIQKRTWGFTDQDLLPLRMLVVCTRIGGQVLGAIDREGKMVGFLNAMPGYRDGKVYLHSHMLGILPEYQNQGIGRSLKWAQRQEALRRGIGLIEWTFDPLEARNARFNIELLGVICRRYLVNTYGITSSPLHRGMPTDRLIAEWHLGSSRVLSRLGQDRTPQPRSAGSHLVELPLNMAEIRSQDPERASLIQAKFRALMQEYFQHGLCVTGFSLDTDAQKAKYHLSDPPEDIATL